MIPNGLKERFELYRKWLNTLLRKEYLNLPSEYQKRFIGLVDKFKKDCENIYKEGQTFKEKSVRIKIEEVLDGNDEYYVATGIEEETLEQVKMRFPANMQKPKVGQMIDYILFSMDDKIWYSTKEELLTGKISE